MAKMAVDVDLTRGTELGEGYCYLRKANIGDNIYHTVMDRRRTERLIIFSPDPIEKDKYIVLSDSSSAPVIDRLSSKLGLVRVGEEGKNMFIYKVKKKTK